MTLCSDCKRDSINYVDFYLTEVNPEGGYGRPQVLVCDDCMQSGRWDDWKAQHWPNWPEERTARHDAV